MAGLALVLELLAKKGTGASTTAVVHSFASFSAASVASKAASTAGLLAGFAAIASDVLFRDYFDRIAYLQEYKAADINSNVEGDDWDSTNGATTNPTWVPEKSYHVNLKPFLSAFGFKALLTTSLRAFLINFQPVLEGYVLLLQPEEDDELDDEDSPPPKEPVDYKAALKGTGWTILREVTIVTTRRLLERIVVKHASKRMSWKLLKDLPQSAERKARRHLSRAELFVGVTKTTFRGHALAVAASWLVQLVLDIVRCFRNIYHRRRKLVRNTSGTCQDDVVREEMEVLWRRIVGNTLKCGASLGMASVGAGLGAVLISPSAGQWIGCAAGEYAGSVIISLWLDSWIIFGTFDPPEVD